MYLKSIELSGFKSFAKKSVLEFNSPISSIVGPNGSGKSNVAEAFRFVLGEQSIKSLRGKKGEDLIFNGAGGEARANRASVKIVFDNKDKTFQIDFPEVVIERAVHRDGVNDYFINGSAVRLKDVVELLLTAHIGASGHHIISQGEADKILNATTKERKAMIEDALGLRLYQYKRIESERKLKKTFENIAQVELLRKEIAPHLKFLFKQVEKMEKMEGMKTNLVNLAKEYFRNEDLYIGLSKTTLSEERQPIDTQLEALAKELLTARKILEDVAKEEKKDYLVLNLESELSAVRTHKDALVRNIGKVEGSLDAEERVIQELATSDENKMVRLKDIENLYEEVSLFSTIADIFDKLKEFIKNQKHFADSSLILDAEKAIIELKNERENIDKDIKIAEEKEKELRARYEELKSGIEKEKDSSRDAERAVFRIMSEENELIGKLGLIKSKEELLKKDEEEFMREMSEVGSLVGADVLHFKSEENKNILEEDRKVQEDKKREIGKLKVRLEDSGLVGSEEVIKEYKDVSERDQFLTKELLDLEKSAESLRELVKDLEERLAVEFSSGITKINKEFGELFSTMFGGGDARLILTKDKKKKSEVMLEDGDEAVVDDSDEDEVVEEGLDIAVNLPRKKIKGLMMLSGGERALTSIALLFGISAVNPPPFIILDETDAALDEANSRRYGDLVEKLAKHSQLILITHNRETMSRAGIIYGVTMSSTGVSKLLSIEFAQAVEVAK
jgi:chromosome segregation protein